MPDTYSVYEAKAKLSEILRLVKARREITITDRGKRVARVVPIDDASPLTLKERLARLREQGVIRAASAHPRELLRLPVVSEKKGALARFLKDRD